MKKLLSIILTILMILSFVACDRGDLDDSQVSSDVPSDTNGSPENTEAETNTDMIANTDADDSTETEVRTETDESTETEALLETDEPLEEHPSMVGFVIDTQVYTTKFEGGKDVHLSGMTSGVYLKPDRSTSCGSLTDGTQVQVLEVCFEGDDITVGWARILVGASKWEVYIRTSQLKCFVLHEVTYPIAPEQLIGKSQLVSSLPEPEKAAIEASFLAMGYRTAICEDGSTMFISNENFEDQLVQNADGSWIEYDGEGNVNQYFDFWKYELLAEYEIPTDREMPAMKIDLLGVSSIEGVAVNFAPDVTLESIKAYAEQLKSFGYMLELSEYEAGGAYVFNASNQKGYVLQLAYADGQGAMMIKEKIDDAFDLTAFMQSGDVIGNYPSEQLEKFERMISQNGGRVEHRAKSTLLVFPDGTAEQFYDGSWLLETDTLATTTGGYFPPNAYTAQLMSVYPSIYGFQNGDTVLYKEEKQFFATFSDATVAKAQQYTSALVMRGAFTMNVRESEGVADGVAVYTFYAESYNYSIEFSCVEGETAAMTITNIEAVE